MWYSGLRPGMAEGHVLACLPSSQPKRIEAVETTAALANKGPSPEKAFDLLEDVLDDLIEERGENDPI